MTFVPMVRFALLLARPGMVVISAPSMGGVYAPVPLRIGLTVMLAFVLVSVVNVPASMPLVGLVLAVLRELAIGLAIGLSMRALVAGAEFAGHVTGFQIGFSYGAIVDPASGVRNNLLAALYGNIALLTLFATNGHHAIMRALVGSYLALPIGSGAIDASLAKAVVEMLGIVFIVGIRLAMPIIVVLLVIEFAMGLISRAAPSLNLLIVGMPVRIVVGLIVIAAVIPIAPELIGRFVERALATGIHAARAFR